MLCNAKSLGSHYHILCPCATGRSLLVNVCVQEYVYVWREYFFGISDIVSSKFCEIFNDCHFLRDFKFIFIINHRKVTFSQSGIFFC